MFAHSGRRGFAGAAATTVELIYHQTVHKVRSGHAHPFVSLFNSIFQNLLLVAMFFVMFQLLGLRGSMIRGDFVMFLMTGIFLFMQHTKTVGAIAGSEGPASPMMKHLPMNTSIAIAAAALSTLYIQVLSVIVILLVYNLLAGPIPIQNPAGAFGMLLLSWFSGVAVGLLFLALKPWSPGTVSVLTSMYQRLSMIASGKMFLANTLPSAMIPLFAWHPLFHTIDQARGFTFVNYTPHYSDYRYAVYLSLTLLTIGLLGEYFTRKHASISWNARR